MAFNRPATRNLQISGLSWLRVLRFSISGSLASVAPATWNLGLQLGVLVRERNDLDFQLCNLLSDNGADNTE
jgi:hypothetical protein